jgi:UPF0755 protein
MKRKTNKSCAGISLFVLLILVGVAIIWIAIPILTEKAFGPATPSLTQIQLRQYGIRLILDKRSILTSASSSDESISFTIEEGSSIYKITSGLEAAGLVKNGNRFRDYLIYKGFDSSIRAGTFLIPAKDSAIEIAEIIRSDNPYFSFFLYPGWRAEEVADGLIASGAQISLEEFMRVVNTPQELSLPDSLKGVPSVEGFLYPDNYELRRDYSATQYIQLFIDRFTQDAFPLLVNGLPNSSLSLPELVTLASIIQRESLVSAELPTIASVFYNRLAIGMKLETDPTVQYAIGYDTGSGSWWKSPLTISDLEVSDRFNTYNNYGLPPHAISNPGLDAIKAVLDPASSPYYFFQASCDGSGAHVFSVTFEEHVSHNCP